MMDELVADIARKLQRTYYGKYRAFVIDNKDPHQLGRVRLKIPSVLGDEITSWALPCVPYGGTAGLGWFVVPDVDAQVWAEFEEGDLRHPIWVGTFWQKQGDPHPPTPRGRRRATHRRARRDLDYRSGRQRAHARREQRKALAR